MERLRCCLVLLIAIPVALCHADADDLATALGGKLPRPDLVLSAVDADAPQRRRFAVAGLAKWHQHIPGAVVCLRRLVNDADPDVAAAAIQAAADMGTREAFMVVVADSLDRNWSQDQVNVVADAIDRRSFRKYWILSDEFGVHDRVEELLARRNQPHTTRAIQQIDFPEPSRPVIESGRQVFIAAGCATCHRVNAYGRDTSGVNMKGIGQCYDNLNLTMQILFPSLDIHDAGIQERLLTVDGQVIVGRVRETRDVELGISTDASAPDTLTWLRLEEIVLREPSPVSPMPTGLLDRLTPTQIADLVIFLRTDGGLVPMPSGSHDDH